MIGAEGQISVQGQRVEGVLVRLGSFKMGSMNGFELERPVRWVEIGSSFWIGKYPVTQAQWETVMGNNPSEFKSEPGLPVENVSWEDCQIFCSELSRAAGRQVRLPTESEWEYACRAGSAGEFFFGDIEGELARYAWFDLNSHEHTHPVGSKIPNAWGLYDMVGNVWEWCEDVWQSDYFGAPCDGTAWNRDFDTHPRRSLRGGAWSHDGFRCRALHIEAGTGNSFVQTTLVFELFGRLKFNR